MKSVTVYRVDHARNTRIPLGSLIERRKKERGRNFVGLLRLARDKFAISPRECLQVDAGGLWIEL